MPASVLCTAVTPGTIHQPAGNFEQTLTQGQNPSVPSRQDQETIRIRTYTLPTGSPLVPPELRAGGLAAREPRLNRIHITPPNIRATGPMTVTKREETRAHTELGAAQKDTSRALAAKLSSLKGIVWVGVALFVFGLASLVWPPLKLVIASVTTSAAIVLGGLALMVLPTLIVGNEPLILGGVVLAVGAWFLAHRHGHLRGQLLVAPKAGPGGLVAPKPGVGGIQ